MPKTSKAEAGYQYRPETQYRCGECVMLKPAGKGKETASGCAWFGAGTEVSREQGSCIYFAHGAPDHPEIPWLGLFTKEELGYVENRTGFSCKRCEYFDIEKRDCRKPVDKDSPGDTPGEIHPNACCDFWEPDPKRSKLDTEKLMRLIALAEVPDSKLSIDEYRKKREGQ